MADKKILKGLGEVFNRDNVVAHLGEDGILTLRIDTNVELRTSRPTIDNKTNKVTPPKSMIIATTSGNPTLPNGMKLGVNVYRALTADESAAIAAE